MHQLLMSSMSINNKVALLSCPLNRGLKQARTKTPTSGCKIKKCLPNPRLSLSISLLWLPCVSIFAEIPLTPASPPEQNDGC